MDIGQGRPLLPEGELKASLQVDGAARLYPFCAAQGVPHHWCGKLAVASSQSEVPLIEALAARSTERCGWPQDRGPALHPHPDANRMSLAVAALWSGSTGLVKAERSFARPDLMAIDRRVLRRYGERAVGRPMAVEQR